MQVFSEALGQPQKKFPVIHVAGTNGKGSTCAMLEALYRSNGYRTGLFSSPHLLHLGERAQVNRQVLIETDIVRYTEILRPIASKLGHRNKDLHPTFFEFIAAMAFLRFATEQVDIACIETGLGGRLDATNVVDPELSIITTISLDHTDILGTTIKAIAREKAGIIKPGKPVLIGNLPLEAEAVVRTIAKQLDSKIYSIKERFGNAVDLPETNLAGSFQRWNAATALHATEILADHFPIHSTEALRQIDWPGRWQTLRHDGKLLILDATHNPEGCRQLTENLHQLDSKPIIVAGTLGEERGRHLMKTIAPFARALHLVCPDQERATSTESLETYLPQHNFPIHHTQLDKIIPTPQTCTLGRSGDKILFTGSIHLIGEVLQRLAIGHPGELDCNWQDKI